jgi:proteasome alpha subunit
MFEEPYRWIEAVRNRREYLEEQLSSGSPIVALPYQEGIVMATLGGGTAKLYEVYDQIAFGGLGHPTDLEKLRTTVLEIAHIEGFNRSPADVNLQRLIKFGIAPVMKQAFEEILHAPFISKLLFVELTHATGGPRFLTLNYDGMFEDNENFGLLAPTAALGTRMEEFLRARGETSSLPLKTVLQIALRAWALSLLPAQSLSQGEPLPEVSRLDTLLKEKPVRLNMEVALLDKTIPGTSKYRSLSREEILSLTQEWLR